MEWLMGKILLLTIPELKKKNILLKIVFYISISIAQKYVSALNCLEDNINYAD